MAKMIEFPVRPIDLAAVDLSYGPCCMSFGFDLQPLLNSIREVGLINSPLLYDNGDGGLGVIIGFRRLLALKSMGRGRVDCRIMEQADRDMFGCLLLNLHDNMATRTFNEVEKGMALTLSATCRCLDFHRAWKPLLFTRLLKNG
ncbi:MAG: ParB N-terminal domain-containing protein [Deltaproteobacteria bacterium]|nr:ParB N-terminal domain-containing protein [Deltaproteobacteria bacterium]